MEDDSPGSEGRKSPKGTPLVPVAVEYCPHCSMPYDFCDFGGKWDTGACVKECVARYPEIFTQDVLAAATHSLDALNIKPKIKAAKQPPMEITIQKTARTRRKMVTSVTGLHLFGRRRSRAGVKLELATKLFSKHFATGATVIKGGPGQPDRIDIQVARDYAQGDVEGAIVELMVANYPGVTADKITRLPAKLK